MCILQELLQLSLQQIIAHIFRSLKKKKKKIDIFKGSVWISLTTENRKHCSKIIFKCVNNSMGPIFNENFVEKRGLWVP